SSNVGSSPAPALLTRPRHRPHAKAILAGCAGLAVQPPPDIRLVERYRHAVVNWSRHLIRIRDDDRARRYAFTAFRILPSVIQASKTQHAPVRCCDVVGLPAVGPLDPFVVAAGRDDAPIALERIPEHRLVSDTLCTGIEAGR